jgi:cell division septum initiation protein DivIVA
MVAKTFGRGTTRGFTRQDFEQLADVVDDSYYTLTH